MHKISSLVSCLWCNRCTCVTTKQTCKIPGAAVHLCKWSCIRAGAAVKRSMCGRNPWKVLTVTTGAAAYRQVQMPFIWRSTRAAVYQQVHLQYRLCGCMWIHRCSCLSAGEHVYPLYLHVQLFISRCTYIFRVVVRRSTGAATCVLIYMCNCAIVCGC